MRAVEDRHWWYVGMQRISVELLAETYGDRRNLRILDAGCGTGAALQYLARFGTVTGIDISSQALVLCADRNLTRIGQASVSKLPFGDGQFDLVTSFDVLYHRAVSDYVSALREFHRVLVPGGRVFLRLPAYDWLRGRHDVVIHTERRFSRSTVATALQQTGFDIERLSYANMLLFLPALGKRLSESLGLKATSDHSDIAPNPPWLDAALSKVLATEAVWLRHRDLPFGLTVLAVGVRP